MVDILMKRGETLQAAEYLLEQLRKRPTMRGFKTLMGLYIDQLTDKTTADSLRLLKELVEKQHEAISELKSEIKELKEKPVMKSIIEPKVEQVEEKSEESSESIINKL